MKASNEELRKVRSAHTSVLHYQTMLFADFHKFRKLDAVHGLNDPVVVEFKKRITSSKTIGGMRQLYIDSACGLWTDVLEKVYALWEDDGYIRMLGLASDGRKTAEQLRDQRL